VGDALQESTELVHNAERQWAALYEVGHGIRRLEIVGTDQVGHPGA
jgi:hypothetical protein